MFNFDKNSCVSHTLDCLKKPFNDDKYTQICAAVVGILLGVGADYLLTTDAKTEDWIHDAMITSSVTMGAAVLTNVALWTIRHSCSDSERRAADPWTLYLPRLVLWESLSFAVGFGVGIGIDAVIEKFLKDKAVGGYLTPLVVSPARTILRNVGFYLVKSKCSSAEAGERELLIQQPDKESFRQ